MLYLNARSIANKIPELHLLINDVKPDIVGITETWLSDAIGDGVLGLDDYRIYRADRNSGSDPHGGVLLAIKPNLSPELVTTDGNKEVLMVSTVMGGKNIKVIICYRTPSMTNVENEEFLSFLANILEHENHCIMIGDYNYPGINWPIFSSSNRNEKIFIDLLNENSLHQHVTEPTRGENILDLILSAEPDLITNCEVGPTFSTSDHCYITCNVEVFKSASHRRYKPNIYRADWDTIRSFFATIDWNVELANLDPNTMCELLYDKIYFAVENFVPKQRVGDKRKILWENGEIKRLIVKKKQKWRLYKRNPTRSNKNMYNRFTKFVSREVKRIKSEYERNRFHERFDNPKFFYKYIDHISGHKQNSDIPSLEVNGVAFTTDYQKSLVLSDQYRSVYTVDDGNIPNCEQKVPADSFCSIEPLENDIVAAINAMNVESSCGPDEIPAKVIKNIMCFLVLPLKIIFQKSFQTGIVPEAWRQGIIVPIYKKNRKPHEAASYRPVCLTSVVAKLAERVLMSYMTPFFLANNIIAKNQHAFIAKRSTSTNLLECLNDWTEAVDGNKPIDILYLDLQKAFDSVPHAKLIYKLKKAGIGGNILKWLENFICCRKHCVRVNSAKSPFEPVESGIAQGTLSGPMLFIMYLNDITELELSSTMKLYADDAKVYRIVKEEDHSRLLQSDIENVSLYLSNWQLTINDSKSEIIHLGNTNQNFQYSIGQTNLIAKNNCRDLGIKISDDQKFSQHVNDIVRTAYYRLKQQRISFTCKDVDFQLHMYTTYIRPLLESNTVIWSPYLLNDIDKIEGVQSAIHETTPWF